MRYQLQQQGLQVNDAPADEEVRETYNFPPGAYGLVYRADIPDHGLSEETTGEGAQIERREYPYHLKAMKWGLVPFWTKRSPDYGSMMRTINCRDDSLLENRGMWTSMKNKKRCIVVCQGFYEWLKKGPGGKEKIPHFVKRKDGQLMCFAGLWDCVQFEDSQEKLYTYTIITTDSNKQLNFLHDRMPVILDAGSDAMKTWLDPTITKWSRELQSLLKPYPGELECYPVSKEVGKVGNNSPNFIVPIDSKENKKNIANFFENAQKISPKKENKVVETDPVENRSTQDHESTENNAPLPIAKQKRSHSPTGSPPPKALKAESESSPAKLKSKSRSAVANSPLKLKASPKKASDGSQKITNFFVK